MTAGGNLKTYQWLATEAVPLVHGTVHFRVGSWEKACGGERLSGFSQGSWVQLQTLPVSWKRSAEQAVGWDCCQEGLWINSWAGGGQRASSEGCGPAEVSRERGTGEEEHNRTAVALHAFKSKVSLKPSHWAKGPQVDPRTGCGPGGVGKRRIPMRLTRVNWSQGVKGTKGVLTSDRIKGIRRIFKSALREEETPASPWYFSRWVKTTQKGMNRRPEHLADPLTVVYNQAL